MSLACPVLQAAGKTVEKAKPMEVKFGIHHVTQLIEAKKAQLVVIAHDVDPIELVVWLPALCRKMGIPYCIIKSKARLGTVVHQKKATALAITGVRNEDQREFAKVCEMCMDQFNNASRVPWGGHILGPKAAKKLAARERLIAKELAQRAAV